MKDEHAEKIINKLENLWNVSSANSSYLSLINESIKELTQEIRKLQKKF